MAKMLFMNRVFLAAMFCAVSFGLSAQWSPVGDKIKTVWGENLDPNNVLPEYPRPIMERPEWQNLNGLWDLAIRPVEESAPSIFNEKILVPFPIESSLSGVGRQVDEKQAIWYRRQFTIPAAWQNRHVLLHFGAVDWKTEVFVNGVKIGSHKGGYTPFSFDITPFLQKGRQELIVKVWDPTDQYFQPRGKQVSKPDNIVYTPVSGIWQTVWLEPVAEPHISNLRILPDIDRSVVSITVNAENARPDDYVRIKTSLAGVSISDTKSTFLSKNDILIPEAKLWTPDEPTLYDLEITLYHGGKAVDAVKSYCAMRKISIRTDPKLGVTRMQLNNKDLVHFGLLDQGYWPDGLYTAPSDEALKFDIVKAKELGCNMLRKHLKVEAARWYTWCDRLGMLVWQDMPSGDNNWNAGGERSPYWDSNLRRRGSEAHENFFREWREIIDCLYSYPSIVMWIPFNEGWGQFRTQEVADLTRDCDPSRLMNVASGWHHIHDGEVLDTHNYPEPRLSEFDPTRAVVLGEYGGIAFVVEGHLWQPEKNFGYIQYKTATEATDKYVEYADSLKTLVKQGFSGAVYTQLSDVEGESNGMLTYDRKIVKLDVERIAKANREICAALDE
jgi:beta-galactosidase/beta-glucuronidase